MTIDDNDGLQQLERAIACDLEVLNLPATNWVPPQIGPDGAPLLDVLIVGGGMCGLAAAFQLRRLGVHNIRVIDAEPPGFEGPWRTFARMETLRSPKHLTGPAAGLPNLTFRAWYEACNGAVAWKPLGNIPREMWADYLDWFARVTGTIIENHVQLVGLTVDECDEGAIAWRTELHSGKSDRASSHNEIIHARIVVLATGREGLAVPRIPEAFAPFHGRGIDHSGDAPARAAMRDRDVVVIGLGASAFDYAAEALEAGARHVRVIGRSSVLSRVNKAKQVVYAGFVHGYPLLADTDKAELLEYIFAKGIAPPRGTVQRVMRHANVELVLAAPVTELTRASSGRFRLTTPQGNFEADRIVLGTGYKVDLNAPAYLNEIASHIRQWRHVLPDRSSAGEFLDFPYLGQGFQFLPQDGQTPAALERLLCFNHAAMLSLGNLANDIPAVSEGADRLARHIAATLYLADKSIHVRDLRAFEDPELLGDEVPGLNAWWPDIS